MFVHICNQKIYPLGSLYIFGVHDMIYTDKEASCNHLFSSVSEDNLMVSGAFLHKCVC